MNRFTFSLLLITLLSAAGFGQSIAGVKVGSTQSSVDGLKMKAVASEKQGPFSTTKYSLPNGNELSVTSDDASHKVVFVEHDWNFKPSASASEHPTFKFGVTTLEEIRKALGSNGLSWRSVAMMRADEKLVTFNAYELKGQPNAVAVFVTSLVIAENQNIDQSKIAKAFKLESIILAEMKYLDSIWGKERIYDPDAKPITW